MVDITCSYTMHHPTISTILKNKDKMMERVKSAVSMMSKITLKKHGDRDGGDGESFQDAHAVSASVLCPTQLSAGLGESCEDVKKQHSEEPEGASFNAIHDWFHWLEVRPKLHNVKVGRQPIQIQ